MKRTVTLLLLAAITSVSFAGVNLTQTGSLNASSPHWNRPLADGSGLSAVGTDNLYGVHTFNVTASGTYTLEMGNPIASSSTIDTFLLLYTAPFSATNQLVNFVAGNDDNSAAFVVLTNANYKTGSLARSSFSKALTAGVNYVLVATTFDPYSPTNNVTYGDYAVGIGGGPGDVKAGAVPEPATFALLGLGALALKRRKA